MRTWDDEDDLSFARLREVAYSTPPAQDGHLLHSLQTRLDGVAVREAQVLAREVDADRRERWLRQVTTALWLWFFALGLATVVLIQLGNGALEKVVGR